MELHAEMGIALDETALKAGFEDALQNTLQFNEAQIDTISQQSDKSLRAAQRVYEQAEAAKKLAEGKAYLAQNAKREGVISTDSGLQYEVITQGSGISPKIEDRVKVHYRGTLLNGTEFDSSFKRSKPSVFPLNSVIKGWSEGLLNMQEGASHRLYIPSDLAYGAIQAGDIPPNSVLIFDIDLIEVNPAN